MANLAYSLHGLLFGSLLLLDGSLGFIIRASTATSHSETSAADMSFSLRQARWTTSGALTSVLTCMTCITLLNKSLDSPGSLLIDNRYLRLGLRLVVMLVALCLPVMGDMRHGVYLGVIVFLLQLAIWWEYIAGLEKGMKLIEPK